MGRSYGCLEKTTSKLKLGGGDMGSYRDTWRSVPSEGNRLRVTGIARRPMWLEQSGAREEQQMRAQRYRRPDQTGLYKDWLSTLHEMGADFISNRPPSREQTCGR